MKNMTMEEYHANPAIGSSTLVAADISPKHFYQKWKGPKEEPTPAQARGTLFHDLLLEQNISHYVARPLNEKGDLVRSNSKEYADFLLANKGKTPIHPDDYKELYTALTSFAENKRVMAMIDGTEIEQTIFAKDPETCLDIKARPDVWGAGYLVDLKTTSYMRSFAREIYKNNYDVRLVHYAKCIEFATGEKIKDLYFVAFEPNAPFQMKVFKIPPRELVAAEDKWRFLVNQVSVCMKTDIWPGFSDEITLAEKPKYLMEEELSFEEAI